MNRNSDPWMWKRILICLTLTLNLGAAAAAPGDRFGRGEEAEEVEPREEQEEHDHGLDNPKQPPRDGAGPIDGERRRPPQRPDHEPADGDDDAAFEDEAPLEE